jgi:tRNA threonylcarbamoyl adenosine modification protein YeaZ
LRPEPLILGFDTSAAHCAAALLSGDRVLAARHVDMGRGQAERLIPLLDEVLAEGGAGWSDLSRIGVGIGPGNFTGIRISVSAARGLALGLGLPAVGVSLLDALALGTAGSRLTCLAAPRGQVYVAGHDTAATIPAQALPLEAVPWDWAEPGLVCIGSGAEAVAAQLGATPADPALPDAVAIARLAALVPTDRPPAPLYLRAADAAPSRETGPRILA